MQFRTKAITVDAIRLTESVLHEASVQAEAGDWLVTAPDGAQRVVQEKDFSRDFEPLNKKPAGAPKGPGLSEARMRCKEPGCTSRSKGPRYGFRCDLHPKAQKVTAVS